MKKTYKGGYLTLKIRYLNGRLFNRYLMEDGRSLYNAEQGKILSALWVKRPQTVKELSQSTALAVSTLTLMLKRLEQINLVILTQDKIDKRKKWVDLTELGLTQQTIGDEVSQKLEKVFYKGFTDKEIEEVDSYLERIEKNLQQALN